MPTFFRDSSGRDLYDQLIPKIWYDEGTLWAWGHNYVGQIGDNSITHRSSPVQTVAGGTNWKQVACGDYHIGAIKTDGTLWMWGTGTDGGVFYNSKGQLGDNTTFHRSSPVQTVAGGTNWKQVSCGDLHTGAIKTDGTLWMWGYNGLGQLGDNTFFDRSSPVQTVTGGNSWKQVSCGSEYTGAIKTDGTLWMWGSNFSGQLGDNTSINRSSPVQTVTGGSSWKQVSCGLSHTGAIKDDGTLWMWGRNDIGQLATNDITARSSPVQTVAGGTSWKQVSCGYFHSGAIKTDGTLWMWGYNLYGELGDNTSTHRSSPVQTIAGGTNWRQLSSGNYRHTSSLKTDGTLWMWGYNAQGQLGDNTRIDRSSPVQTVTGGSNWKQVDCGLYHTSCVKDDGL